VSAPSATSCAQGGGTNTITRQGYDIAGFIGDLRAIGVTQHVAQIT
jgi:hypothetical protein